MSEAQCVLFFPCLVVTGATDGIGKAYAEDVSFSAEFQPTNGFLSTVDLKYLFSGFKSPCLFFGANRSTWWVARLLPWRLHMFSRVHRPVINCLQLARRGFAIVLISRSQDKLDELSKAIGELAHLPCQYFPSHIKVD